MTSSAPEGIPSDRELATTLSQEVATGHGLGNQRTVVQSLTLALTLAQSSGILSELQVLHFKQRRDHQNCTLLTWEDCWETESGSC